MSVNFEELGKEIALIPSYKHFLKELLVAYGEACHAWETLHPASEASSLYLGFCEDIKKAEIEL